LSKTSAQNQVGVNRMSPVLGADGQHAVEAGRYAKDHAHGDPVGVAQRARVHLFEP
jgi:hypothetical protein